MLLSVDVGGVVRLWALDDRGSLRAMGGGVSIVDGDGGDEAAVGQERRESDTNVSSMSVIKFS